jgi:protein SDA1
LEAFASYVRNSNGSRNNALFNNFILNFISRYCNELDGKKPSSISILSHSLSLMIRLFSKGTWRNPKVVNLIVFLGLRVNSLRLIVLVSSFLAGETRLLVATGPELEETVVKSKDIHIRMKIAGRSKKLERKLDRVSKKENKEEEDAKPKLDQSLLAIQMIDNPYEVAEKLIGLLKQGTIAGEHIQFKAKLVIMKALSRLVGLRKLILPDLYPFLRRYIQPHQKEVPQILAFSVQSVHGEIPDESVQELLKAISHAFIAEHCSDEVIASGICAVREICRRNNAIQEELLNEIAAYCSAKKDKIVKAAARGLVNLYRDIDPSKLDKKFRGRILSVRQDSDQSSEDESSCEELLIEPKAITQFKKKNDYESRVKSVMAGREGRDRFGSRKRHHLDKNVSKTNKVKSKRKPMAMRKARISKRK